ncbi:hypothetical protein [Methylobacterium ajmalii]|mgnify:CR=1 FL=1|jgi:hypothetical protein|uniref:hypothetical protein n=1 Tax=Methylobacterium ajmalii TaxID=2738439 RepID=UPI00190BAD36|nr:hypothetical protein [Methylobacterium ajmalii]MBK3400416.1 hypothetical protein [Methylobacterium ajmalii]MBK3407542.1 hypothetical protein [Methylobacterium ajmalii]MBK3422110.1 hypothetical protein [Methylobacterium ajmalii]MBZ6415620.1 hypothetical protein [Methylobacterium sp.]
MASTAEPEGDAPRKGRGNAILTYETVAALDAKLVRLDAKMDGVVDGIRRQEADHADHEARLRFLEGQMAGIAAASAATNAARVSTRTEYQWAWGVLLTVISLGLSVLTYLHK